MSTYPLTLTPLTGTLFDEFVWRNDAILSVTRLTLSTVARKSKISWYHIQILQQLGILAQCKRELVDLFHTKDAVVALGQATPDQLRDFAEKMATSQEKTVEMLKKLRSLDKGFWRPVYNVKLSKIEDLSREVDCHIRIFANTESNLVLLTKKDQEHFIAALINPPEPTEEVRRAFSRK
jgi:hypothetical protein